MNKLGIIIPLGCLSISSSLCEAATIPMVMNVGGHAVLQPGGQYEVPVGGSAIFTAKLPKMPVRNQEIWLFKKWNMSWILDGTPNTTNLFTYKLTKNPDRGPIQINISSLLTYMYLHRVKSSLDYDYGQSDIVILNFK